MVRTAKQKHLNTATLFLKMTKKIIVSNNTSINIYLWRLPLFKMLENEGYEVILVASVDEYTDKLEELGLKVIRVPLHKKGTNVREDFRYMRSLYQVYKRENPHLIIHYTIKPNIYGTLAASILKIPSICTVTGLGTVFMRDSLGHSIAKFLYKVAFKRAKVVFFQNPEDRKLFIREQLCPEKVARLVPGSGINTQIFQRNTPYPPQNPKFTFLYFGRLLWDKGVGELVEATRILKEKNYDFQLNLAGSLSYDNSTLIPKSQVEEWEQADLINYIGKVDRKDVPQLLQSADCVVLPSYREGLSMSLLEASAMEVPLLASDVAGCKDVVQDGETGFLFEVKNAQDLADKMQKMLDLSIEQRQKMGKNARNFVQSNYSIERVMGVYKEVVKEMVG